MPRSHVLFGVILLVPCAAGAAEPAAPGGNRLTPAQVAQSVTSTMDRTANPCDDFYRYACGTWLDTTKMPTDRPRWSRSFTEITERNLVTLREILDGTAKSPGGDAIRKRLGAFYGSCTDEAAVEKAAATPLKPMLDDISKVTEIKSLMTEVGKLHSIGVSALFGPTVLGDFKDPDTNIAHFFQGGLGLPDRDYYIKDDDRSKTMLSDYQAHVGNMLTLLGESKEAAAAHAKDIVAFETELAKASLPKADSRNPDKIYHKMDIAGLKTLTPQIPWDAYLAAAGTPGLNQLNVGMPEFMTGMAALVGRSKPETLQTYLRWHLVNESADQLSKAFVDEHFAFYGQKLSGQKEQKPRWKRCVEVTDGLMGEALGQAFVDRQFSGESKDKALEMVHGIEGAFERNLPNLAWMDDTTRQRALVKMHAITNKIGYPDHWRDYSSLVVKPGDYFGNVIAANQFEFRRNTAKIGKPVDRTEWGMTPPTVNAYYNPLANEIVFPAGIMQRPFFDRDFSAPMNFGGMGMVVGHELTHGFDDQGRKFDAKGQLAEWWEPEVSKKFEERAQCVDDLYSSYEVQPGVHLNGKLTLGENLADLGGLKEAFSAWKEWAKKNGEPAPLVEGLTNDQLFFVSFAQNWCTLATPEIQRMLATVDPHSAAQFRVIGPASNFPEFGKTFQCAEGTKMNPAKKCEVW